MMKKAMMAVLIGSLFLVLTGCLDYKAYDFKNQPAQNEDAKLLDEIAAIEDEILQENGTEEDLDSVTEEEVVLPDLEAEVPEQKEVTEDTLYTLTVKENQLVRVHVNVSDPDGDTVSYSFSKPLNKDGEWQTSYGDAGEYIVTLAATDGVHTTEKKIKIMVERVNVAPVIEGVRDLQVDEGDTVTFEPTVSDPNKDEVTITISEPLKEGSWETDHTSAGEYQIRVVASDGELETEKSFKLVVRDIKVKPEISNLEDLTVKEGDVVTLKPVVNDLDNDKVTITISEPVGDDGTWETSYKDHGEYQITISADDGKDRVSMTITVLVQDVNVAPIIKDVYLG